MKEYDAETKRAQVLAPAFGANQIQALVMQTMRDILPELALYQQPEEPMPMAPPMEMMADPMLGPMDQMPMGQPPM